MSGPCIHLALGEVPGLAREACADGLQWLSAPEQSRLAKLSTPLRRAQFIGGRWLARKTLAQAFGGDAQRWSLDAPGRGPPRVHDREARDASVWLNLSHSAGHVVCAAGVARLGVDLEAPTRRRDVRAMANLVCTEQELARLDSLAEDAFDADFYALWTLKEAWLKRTAQDLSPSRLAQIDARQAEGQPGNARLWRSQGFTMALAGDAPDTKVRWLSPPQGMGDGEMWRIDDAAMPSTALR